MQELNERVAKAETRLDNHDRRLDAHGRELEEMRIKNAKQDSKLDELCHESKENTAMTRSIKGGVDTIKWLFGVAMGLAGLYFTLKQLGWF